MGLLGRITGSASMTPAAAAAGVADGSLLLVDVREPSEVARMRIEGARTIPLGTLGRRVDELARDGRRVAFVCQSGVRSARAVRTAAAAGVQASNVRGGVMAWQRAGLPVVRR